MGIRHVSMAVAAAMTIGGAIAIAQAPSVNFAGCVQKESSVLKRSPIAGDVGMDDEFVLTFARPAPAPSADDAAKAEAEAPAEPAAASSSPGNFGTVYRLTGDKEKELKGYLGQRVEISGTFKEKEKTTDALSSIGTSGRVELTPANTAEITIDAIRPVSGSCAPVVK